MFTKCQDFYTLGVEIKFKKEVGILLGGCLTVKEKWGFFIIYHQNKIIYHQFYHQKTQEARE